jgi:hypothetical protein
MSADASGARAVENETENTSQALQRLANELNQLSQAMNSALLGAGAFQAKIKFLSTTLAKTEDNDKAMNDYKKNMYSFQQMLGGVGGGAFATSGKLGAVSASMNLVAAAADFATTAVNAEVTAFNAAADLAAGNIDELVGLYNAQINVISSQNRYTQALALQATAAAVYGAGTEQATRATTAANYVGALYTQSKKNELVAQNTYYMATAKNMALIASSSMEMIQAFANLGIAMTALMQVMIMDVQRAATGSSLGLLGAIPIIGTIATLGYLGYEAYQASQSQPTASIRGYQTGGLVTETGPIFAHAGETVVPAGGFSEMSPNANFYITATSNVDLAKLRQEVERGLANTMYQAKRQRGIYG